MRNVSSGPTGLWAVLEEGGGVLARYEAAPWAIALARHCSHFQTRRNDSFLPGGARLGASFGGRMEASDSERGNLLIFNILSAQHADLQ